jgi:hypothetical protein
LVHAYKRVFETGLQAALSEEQKTVLAAAFGGLVHAVTVESKSVVEIWQIAFTVLTKHVEWAWNGDSKVGTLWTNAMEARLVHRDLADLEEKKDVKRFTGRYLEKTVEAPAHPLPYHEIARLNADLRHSINPSLPGFRTPDRAILLSPTPIQITLRGVSSTPVMEAQLVNFSLNDAHGRIVGRGAYAIAPRSPEWVPDDNWRDASVRVPVSQQGGVLFDQARVLGPIPERDGENCYCGFRIELGPASPEGAIHSLKAQWDALPKR